MTAPLTAGRLRTLDLTATGGDQLTRFYRELYVAEFPEADERESLENMLAYLRSGDGSNAYLVTLVLDGDRIVAGCVADYFVRSSCGAIEFLVVDPRARGSGIGARLAAHVEQRMHAAARDRDKTLALVMAEINDPFKRAATPDNVDPFARLGFWARRGYRRLVFPYQQPALSDRQAPVENLLLAAKPAGTPNRAAVPAALVEAFLRDYLIYAMRIADPAGSPQFARMAAYLGGRETVALEDLDVYAGNDSSRPLDVRAIESARDPDFAAAMAVYRGAFPDPRTAIAEAEFADRLTHRRLGTAYHLWAVRASGRDPVEGMASFFGLTHAGFGGYVALVGALRGGGRLRPLLARIERCLAGDSPAARGWYVECAPDVTPIFERCGFFRIPLPYRQPALHGSDVPLSLALLYKEFGASYAPPEIDPAAFAAAMSEIETEVYGHEPAGGASLFGGARSKADGGT